jgi:hypothetical protein
MTKARDISKLLSTANGKIAGENLDVSFENITDTGTEGTRVATGTTAQRGSTAGQLRFNSETGLAEYYTGTTFKTIDAPPTVTSLDVTEVDSQAGGNQTIVITGSNFQSGATVTFVGNTGTNFNASTVTVDSDAQITVVAPKSSFLNAQEPYGVKVTNTSGLSATLASQINVDTSPSWSTASGSLGSLYESDSASFSVSATDPDGDTVAYSETGGTVLSTNGLSINSSTGAITGTAGTVSADTTLNFDLRATANSKTADRAFSIIILDNPMQGVTAVYDQENGNASSISALDSAGSIQNATATTSIVGNTWQGTKLFYLPDGGNCGNWHTLNGSFNTSGGVTICFWAKSISTNNSADYRLFDCYSRTGYYNDLFYNGGNEFISSSFHQNSGNQIYIDTLSGQTSYNMTDWHFYAFRYTQSPTGTSSGTERFTIDVGGTLYHKTSGSTSLSSNSFSSSGFMGFDNAGSSGANSYNWEGYTGGWLIYNQNLSDTQISYLYNNGAGRF